MNYIEIYADFLKKHASIMRPLKVIADCSNGTAGVVLTHLKDIPNLDLRIINEQPDPDFTAHGPNPLNPGATDQLVKAVLESKADIGVIFDADADRAFFVDDKGETLPSFIIAVLLFRHNQPPFVADETVFKSLQHLRTFKETDLHPSRVGSYFVKQVLREVSGSVAAEFSGHYYYKDFFNADSGIFTMIQVLNTLSHGSESLTQFCASLPQQFLKSENIKLTNKTVADVEKILTDQYKDNPTVLMEHRDGITLDFGDAWISIRSSNTEPLLRLIAGSKSDARSAALIAEIASLV